MVSVRWYLGYLRGKLGGAGRYLCLGLAHCSSRASFDPPIQLGGLLLKTTGSIAKSHKPGSWQSLCSNSCIGTLQLTAAHRKTV